MCAAFVGAGEAFLWRMEVGRWYPSNCKVLCLFTNVAICLIHKDFCICYETLVFRFTEVALVSSDSFHFLKDVNVLSHTAMRNIVDVMMSNRL